MNGGKSGVFCIMGIMAMTLGWGCATAKTQAPARMDAGRQSAVIGNAEAKAGEGTAGRRAEAVIPALSPTRACLKEGEPCNTLNDQCCSGYYCFGGLVPTCVRKP